MNNMDKIKSKPSNKAYRDGWDRTFKKNYSLSKDECRADFINCEAKYRQAGKNYCNISGMAKKCTLNRMGD